MFISELIVSLWFVPVVLFVAIPLSVLCFWAVHRLMRRITERIELAHQNAEATRGETPVQRLRPRPAV
ncbi:MAG: hypothetical protein ACN4GW_19605 [Desulforhopalus sp.]